MAQPVTLRPGELTTLEQREAIEAAVLEYLEANASPTIRGAALAAGISHVTLYRLMDSHPAMAQRVQRTLALSERAAVDEVLDAHFDLASGKSKAGHVVAQIHILKHRRRQYAEAASPFGPNAYVHIDKAQIILERETTDEMRRLESPQSPDS